MDDGEVYTRFVEGGMEFVLDKELESALTAGQEARIQVHLEIVDFDKRTSRTGIVRFQASLAGFDAALACVSGPLD